MSFLLDSVPTMVTYQVGRHNIPKDLSLSERFELLVAQVVQGRLAEGCNAGFDVYDSILHPGLTFQVKVSSSWADPGTDAKKKNRSEIYTFNGIADGVADYYILFGLRDGQVFPFVLPLESWQRYGSKTGKRRILIISAERYTRRTKALKENRLWNCYIGDWPDGLHRRLKQRQLILV